MIASLTGVLKAKTPTEVLIDVQGVGYAVNIPLSTFEGLGTAGSTVTLLTHLQVREDALQLYGFATEDELILFRLLISVTGIGPRIAQGILSGIPAAELRNYILQGNVAALIAIPGVGRKTAERLVVELRDRIGRAETAGTVSIQSAGQEDPRTQALLALTSLGYSRQVAERAVRAASAETNSTSVEELIKTALKHTSNK
ncbi:MAG: Holliday junction ATP-dependent DNA helicase RuvA [Bacteroidia bacterium]|nr:MAG: Holliday junction ATP-dependent DNA helicase RuvA [Bacteroidia bacterium]